MLRRGNRKRNLLIYFCNFFAFRPQTSFRGPPATAQLPRPGAPGGQRRARPRRPLHPAQLRQTLVRAHAAGVWRATGPLRPPVLTVRYVWDPPVTYAHRVEAMAVIRWLCIVFFSGQMTGGLWISVLSGVLWKG